METQKQNKSSAFRIRATKDEIANYHAFCKKFGYVFAARVRALMEKDIEKGNTKIYERKFKSRAKIK